MAFRVLPVALAAAGGLCNHHVSCQPLPGASPEVMASSVATPLERQFGHIAGITCQMTSTSTLGNHGHHAAVRLHRRDVDGAARDVQAAINAARNVPAANLPSNPDLPKGQLGRVSGDGAGHDFKHALRKGELFDTGFASVVQQKLSQVEGVGQVTGGGRFAACGARRTESAAACQLWPGTAGCGHRCCRARTRIVRRAR